jgi:hypothetical protein
LYSRESLLLHLHSKVFIFVFLFALFSLTSLCIPEKPSITIVANYLAYSYDWDILYAEDEISIEIDGIEISCDWLRIDFKSNNLSASGKVVARYKDSKKMDKEIAADLFELKLNNNEGRFLVFDEEINEIFWPEKDEEKESYQPIRMNYSEISRTKIESSFLYYLGSKMVISPEMEVTGYDVIFFIEGIPSFRLSKRKLRSLQQSEKSGFEFKSIRFASSQGLLTGIGYHYRGSGFFSNDTDLYYQERGLLRGTYTPERIARIDNQASFRFGENDDAQFSSYYDTAAGWWGRLRYSHRFTAANISSIEFFHRETFNQRPESWIIINNIFKIAESGNLNTQLRYELQHQYATDLSYSQILPAGFSFALNSSYNKRQPTGYLSESEIFNGTFNLNYANRYVSLQTGYSMNRDLLADRSLTQPSLIMQANPLRFYGDLLAFTISNAYYYSTYQISGMEEQKNYNNNLALDFSNIPINLFKNTVINLNLRIEQLMRSEGENTTSGAMFVSLQRWISERSYWRIIYGYQTRRPTKNWLIEGMNSQDITAQIRIQPLPKILTWLSVSMDPEIWQMKSSNTNIIYDIGRRWLTEVWASYDFQMGSLNNLDFILAKDLQRAELRFKWRHLTREFLFEFVPKF